MNTDAYNRYKTRVDYALNKGYSRKAIIDELQREKRTIQMTSVTRAAMLATDRNIYKKREVIRAAGECRDAIDQLCQELEKEEMTA